MTGQNNIINDVNNFSNTAGMEAQHGTAARAMGQQGLSTEVGAQLQLEQTQARETLVQKGPCLEQELDQLRRAVEHLQGLRTENPIEKPAVGLGDYIAKGNMDFSMFSPSDVPGYSELEFDFSAPDADDLLKQSLIMSLCDVRLQKRGRKHNFVDLYKLDPGDQRAIKDTHSMALRSDQRTLYSDFEVSVATESFEVSENGAALDDLIRNQAIDAIMNNHDRVIMGGEGITGSVDAIGKVEGVPVEIKKSDFDEQIMDKLIQLKNMLPQKHQDGAIFLVNPIMMGKIESAMKREGEKLNPIAFLREMKFYSSEYFSDEKVLLFNPKQYRVVASNFLIKMDDKLRRGDLIIYVKQYIAGIKKNRNAFVYLNVTGGTVATT